MIAAHKTLRFGAHVRGAYLDNGRVVMVTVVDRGPLIRGRVIDVCASAADELGFRQAGVARVKQEKAVRAERSPLALSVSSFGLDPGVDSLVLGRRPRDSHRTTKRFDESDASGATHIDFLPNSLFRPDKAELSPCFRELIPCSIA
jgi:rare lipoprotein A (peptidoglycan hydrolase)